MDVTQYDSPRLGTASPTNTDPSPSAKEARDRADSFVPESPTIKWCREAVDESRKFLKSQVGWDKMQISIDAIMGEDQDGPWLPIKGSELSRTRTNRLAKITEDLASMLTDIKPFWEYQVLNRRFEQQASIAGKLATGWYQQQNVDMALRDAIVWNMPCGTSVLYECYDPDLDEITLTALDPRRVYPIRPRAYDSFESCQGVIVEERVPCSYIKDKYNLTIDAEFDLDVSRDETAGETTILSPIHRAIRAVSNKLTGAKLPGASLFTFYLKDPRVNETSSPIRMGKWWQEGDPDLGTAQWYHTNWSYIVLPGEPLYPNRRMITWVGNHLLYDGPSYYWHGRFPTIKFTLNPMPWSWFGKAPLWDLLALQNTQNRLLRVFDDHAAQVAQPPVVVDKNNVSKTTFDQIDTRKPGLKVYQNVMAGKGVQIIAPPPLDSFLWNYFEWIPEELKELSGVADITQLTKMNQLPANSTVESILNAMTPGVRARSRVMETVLREVAMQYLYNATQFITLAKRVTILGPSGLVQDDFDFDPGSFVPDHVHEHDYDSSGSYTPQALMRGPLPRMERSREFLRRFTFKIAPNSLLNAAQLEQKMIYLQLARAGWMDVYTLWEVLGIPNIGVLPSDIITIPQRLAYQQSQGLTGDVNPAGRKASGNDAPRPVVKES